jgi:hypothetical protein
MSGRSYFEESTASIAQKIVHLKGENTELTKNFEEFVSTSLLNLGFSEVVVRLSPFAKAMSDLVINAEILTEEECLKFLEKSKEYAGESAEIDPVFLEASLGSMYIVATR